MNENYNDNYMDETKKSGTVLKVVLIIITVVAVVAAVAMGLLFYNAKSNVELLRDKNTALSEDRTKAMTQLEELQGQISEYEKQIKDLAQQLEDAQAQLELMVPAVNDGDSPDTSGSGAAIDLSNNKDLSVKPDQFFDKGVDYTVAVKGLNIRSGPGTTYKQLASVNMNSTVTAYAAQDDWLLVSYKDNAYGWVKASFVTKK